MLLNSQHKPWMRGTLVVAAASALVYGWYAAHEPGGARGGSVPGLLFGVAASALMLFCGALGLRKKVPLWPIGSAQTWLRAHIWLGLLSVPWVGFHAGWRLGGPIEIALWLILAAIVASGLIGLLLQQFLPRYLTSSVSLETFHDQIGHVCQLLQLDADVEVAGWCGPLEVRDLPPPDVLERLSKEKAPGIGRPIVVYRSQVSGDVPTIDRPAVEIDAPEFPAALLPRAAATPTTTTPTTRSTAAEPEAAAAKKPGEKLSVQEKLAMMRGVKGAPAAPEKPTADAASDVSTAASTTTAEIKPPLPAKPAAPKPAAGMTAAEKIAAMRARSAHRAVAETASQETAIPAKPPAAESPPAVPQPAEAAPSAKPAAMSAAEKIAAMRAAKAAKPAEAATPAPAAPATPATPAQEAPAQKAPAAAKEPAKPARPAAGARGPAAINPTPGSEPLREFYQRDVRPFLAAADAPRTLASPLRSRIAFRDLRARLVPALHEVVDHLEAACDERRQLRQQARVYYWLHGWLVVHVPLSWALLVLGLWHVYVSLRY